MLKSTPRDSFSRGYPTGVGALIIRAQTAFELKKHYWGGLRPKP